MKKILFGSFLLVLFLILLTGCMSNVNSAPQATATASNELIVIPTGTAEPVVVSTPVPLPEEVVTPNAGELPAEECAAERIQPVPDYDGALLFRFETDEHFVVLTIDDGYYDDVMNQMLDLLEADGATATFFLLGRPVADNFSETTMQRLVNNGNDISYHAFVHPKVASAEKMTQEEWNQDYQMWTEALRLKLGDDLFEKGFSPFARVPYGPWTNAYLSFTKENGLTPVFWSADNHAFEPKRMPLRDGGILILHAVPEDIPVLQTLLENDWKVISLSQAMAGSCK